MYFLLITLLFTLGISQEKTIELEDIFNRTFSSSGISRSDWVNGEDAYYFSKKDSTGMNFFKYSIASDDTTRAFSIDKNQISQFTYTFSGDQKKILLQIFLFLLIVIIVITFFKFYYNPDSLISETNLNIKNNDEKTRNNLMENINYVAADKI